LTHCSTSCHRGVCKRSNAIVAHITPRLNAAARPTVAMVVSF